MILTCSIIEAMKMWGELLECYHGINGYGSTVAEIYSYRLEQYTPTVHNSKGNDVFKRELEVTKDAAMSLYSIIEKFCENYECTAMVEGMELSSWKEEIEKGNNLMHRYHVEILK